MPVMTRKIQIIPEGDINETYQTLRDWRYHSWKLANTIMSEKYAIMQQTRTLLDENPELKWNEVENDLMKKRLGEYAGKSTNVGGNFDYCLSKFPQFSDLPSRIRSGLTVVTKQSFKTDKKQLLSGSCSLRNYKLDSMNIYIPSGNGKVNNFLYDDETKEYYFKTIQKRRFKVNLGKDKSNNREILDRLISGVYKMPDVFLKLEKKKIFVYVPITFEKEEKELDKNISVGVDLGLAVPAYCAVNKGLHRLAIGTGKEITDFRFQMKKRREALYRGIKLSNGGRGRKAKMKATDKLRSYESNWVKTKNHKISKKIIDFALDNQAGTIKLELLEGFTKEHSENMVLKNWTYFQLQEMIKYKADRVGIEVVYVDPYHTSQECSKCGHTHKGNRKDQKTFICTECGFSSNADYNAAVNIARSEKFVKNKAECTYTKLKNKKGID